MIPVISILKYLGKKTNNKGKKKATLLQKAWSIVFKMFDIGMQAIFMLKAYWSDEQSKERWHLRYSLKEMDFSQQDWDRETQYVENIVSRSVRE